MSGFGIRAAVVGEKREWKERAVVRKEASSEGNKYSAVASATSVNGGGK